MDHRADIFALGVMMYEVCLGVHPFDASTEANIIDRLLKAAYRRPREIDPGFPKDLDRLITSCMAVHPDARPPDMRAVVESIVTHLEKHKQVPTMRIVSELVHSLIPDTESPQPLEPMSAQRLERAWGDAESGENATQRKQPRDTEETKAPPHANREHTVPIRASPVRRRDDDSDTLIANRPPIEELTVPVVGASALDLSDEMTAAAPLPARRVREAREETMIAGSQKRRRSGSPLRQVLLFVGSATLVLGVGIAAFVTARAISGSGAEAVVPEPAPSEPPPAAEPPPSPRLLHITSEPVGASIFIDGAEASLVTPATLPIPPGRDRVVIRTALDGFVTQERPIHATAGEARFVLTALTTPDAATDAQADADAGQGPRPRMWRRRGMRRR
jgi:serine/threonine-protein kinase